ncbi:hypothetical protein ACHAC9_13230 [Massilia sp. CMS3.1]|uniref:type IV toxin-antitoxin system AbiEi family antitoxin domain-containing protein n=1 Tax=Massilia sp. CMS3.1 TaxID=3373083 RepID=UPI003EE4685E
MSKSRIHNAKPAIAAFLDDYPTGIFKPSDIATILAEQRSGWALAKGTGVQAFTDFLCNHAELAKLTFPFPYRSETRYTWGKVSLMQVLLSLKTGAYFSHLTAANMLGLVAQTPSTIYLNHEQRPQPQDPHLAQGRIDAAFARRPRASNNAIEFGAIQICMINGMHTNQMGVINKASRYDGDDQGVLRLTGLERTLIDMTVRPVYSGGVDTVRTAFELAQGALSVKILVDMLQKLKFVYPFHQSIGYYLERAGYAGASLDLLRRMPTEYDFYLEHQMQETRYEKGWRLHVPASW